MEEEHSEIAALSVGIVFFATCLGAWRRAASGKGAGRTQLLDASPLLRHPHQWTSHRPDKLFSWPAFLRVICRLITARRCVDRSGSSSVPARQRDILGLDDPRCCARSASLVRTGMQVA